MNNEVMVEQIRRNHTNRREMLGELYKRNRPIIYQTVRPFIDGGMEEDDAMQTAFFGLLEAVNRYDPERGRFATYLPYWVRAAVSRSYTDTGRIKRVPGHMADLMRKYTRFCQRWKQEDGAEPADQMVCSVLRISMEQLQDLKRFMVERERVSLSDQIPGAEGVTVADSIPDPLADPEGDAIASVDDEQDARRIWERVDALPELQPKVLRLRYQQQETMSKAAEKLGVTCNQIRQQEDKAMRRLRRDRTLRRIAESRGYGSRVYHGSLSRFLLNGSIVEELAMKELEQSP